MMRLEGDTLSTRKSTKAVICPCWIILENLGSLSLTSWNHEISSEQITAFDWRCEEPNVSRIETCNQFLLASKEKSLWNVAPNTLTATGKAVVPPNPQGLR